MYQINHNQNGWLDRFCARHPRLGIPNLMLYIAIANVAIYLIDTFSLGGMSLSSLLIFSRAAIFQGQVWRLITFVLVPLSGDILMKGTGLFFVAISAYFYYWIGSMLERQWGTTKFTVFYVSGVILNIIVGMITGYATIYYVNMSMFFAFATLFGETRVLFMYIIPVKVKWLAWLDAAYFIWEILQFLMAGLYLFALLPVVAILNYLIYFWNDFRYLFFKTKRRAANNVINFQQNAKAAQKAREHQNYHHKCAVCGVTDVDDPDMEFRYCSKCDGYYCYCMNHINSHVHIHKD